mmetsp:Transcript_9162/g.41707  ORF Transcript_9162/g.41707 Transcript_9162/m.41707 type:complete len:234 (-) Transcript_9162:358-1059(-)
MNARFSFGSVESSPSRITLSKHLGTAARFFVAGYGSMGSYTVTGAGGAAVDSPGSTNPASRGGGSGGSSGGGGGNGGGAGGGAAYLPPSSRSNRLSGRYETDASGTGARLQSTYSVTIPSLVCPTQLPVLCTLKTYFPGPSGTTLSLDACPMGPSLTNERRQPVNKDSSGVGGAGGGGGSASALVPPRVGVVRVSVSSVSSSTSCSHGLDLYPTGETALGASITDHVCDTYGL